MVGPANWQDPPYNRWAFWHAREILPSQVVRRAPGSVRAFAPGEPVDIGTFAVTRVDGGVGSVADVMDETYTDAYVVVQDGALVAERYGPEGAPERTHALMSISKSVGCAVAGVLVGHGRLDPDGSSSTTSPNSRLAATPARRCATCSTCAAALRSARTTPTHVRHRTDGNLAGLAPGRRTGSRDLRIPDAAVCYRRARWAVPVPVGGDRRARVGVRTRSAAKRCPS